MRRNTLVCLGFAIALLSPVALAHAQAVTTVTGPLWSWKLLNNQYQLYRVSSNQATTKGGNVAQVTWPAAIVPVWAGISAFDDSKDDAVNGLLAIGKTTFAPADPLMNTISAVPDCSTAVIKIRNLSQFPISPFYQWFTLTANVTSITWASPPTFSRTAGPTLWNNNHTQGTVDLVNTGGVTAHDVTLTILDALRNPITAPVPIASAVGANAPLNLTFAVPPGVQVGDHLYLQLDFHFCGESGRISPSVYVGQ